MSSSDATSGAHWKVDGPWMTLFNVTFDTSQDDRVFPLWTGSQAEFEGGPELIFRQLEKVVQDARRTGPKGRFHHVSVKTLFASKLGLQGQLPLPTLATANETHNSITVTLLVDNEPVQVKIWAPEKTLPREVAAYDKQGLLI